MEKFTKEEAYMAMFFFLEKHYDFTKSDDIGALLGAMRILEDGMPVDNALWSDWDESLKKASEYMKS
jgi:hypothetical protein